MTQVVSFLVVGFFISVMVGWLNKQRRSLGEANSKLTNYAQTLEDLATSKERNRIAQELHDTLSHTLSGISVQLETMKAYWDVDPTTARKRLDKSLFATRSGLEETRRILMALRAKPLEDLGLAPAIHQMAEEAASRAGIALDLAIADNIPYLSPGVEQCFFRVAQEAITNVLIHAKAHRLTVKLELKESKVELTVQDDGVGFDVKASNEAKHFGLLGMKERVEFVKGELNITSQPGIGTIVQLAI
jgi:signal transduction histidine kinase